MANYQDCKDEPKYCVHSAHRLGNCFAEEGWFKEASSEYKEVTTWMTRPTATSSCRSSTT